MEDLETNETLILKEQRELEDQKEIIELREVCVFVCVSVHHPKKKKIT